MTTYILTADGLMDKKTGQITPRSEFTVTGFPRVMRGDEQEPLVSMADGKTYTSKAAMRESYKAKNNPQGVNYVELGNESRTANPVKRKPDRAGIKDAVERAASEMRTRGELA